MDDIWNMEQQKGELPYLGNKCWLDVTRDERYFCAELFFQLKRSDVRSAFLAQINRSFIGEPIDALNTNAEHWEVGLEVAFYRDSIHALGFEGEHHIRRLPQFSQKRTFDLCLFSKERLVIIEAKSFMGLETKQLQEFADDRGDIALLLKDRAPEVILIGLWSSAYQPRKELRSGAGKKHTGVVPLFNGHMHWRDLCDLPGIDEPSRRIFSLADATKRRDRGQVPSWENHVASWKAPNP